MPEYGREIQKMVDYAIALPDKEQRLVCAKAIVKMMEAKVPQLRDNEKQEQTLWDHLYLISHKQLDIDWPYDVSAAEKILSKPNSVPIPGKGDRIRQRHYGRLLEGLFERLKTMPEGPERDELTRLTANHMKRDLVNWGHGSIDNEKVADDLARFTDGKIQLDLNTFKFERIDTPSLNNDGMRRKRRK